MSKAFILAGALMITAITTGVSNAGVVDDLLAAYKAQGVAEFSAARGKEMWTKEFKSQKTGKMISCATCHTADLKQASKHVETGEPIEPLAPSVNPKRLTDPKFIEKWFGRNCKQTLGRECTAQEKGDFLMFMRVW
jgi:hypothetical protein